MDASNNATMPPGPLWEGYDMTQIFSPFYWGTVVSLVLSGITILQAYMYFPSKDRLGVQAVAVIMIVLDIASTVLCAEGMYIYFVPRFGSMLPLATLTPSLSAECYLSVIITLISQLYFAWQIFTVMGRRNAKYIFSGSVVLFSIVAFVAGIVCSTVMILDKENILAQRSYRFAVAVGVAKGAAAIADILVTVCLCYCLGSARTGIKRTDSLVKALMGYVVQRGILVTLIQVLFLIFFFATSDQLYWLAFHVNVTRLYANTFFAMLNGRDRLKRVKGEKSTGSTYVMSLGSNNKDMFSKKEEATTTNRDDTSIQHIGENTIEISKNTVVISDHI